MNAAQHSVLIVGAGPTGLMLACELALARVDVAIVERRAAQDLEGLRAGGLHMRTLEMLDQRGLVERFVAEGTVHRAAPFAGGMLDTSDLPTRHNYFLGLWQVHVERILGERARELGVTIYRDAEVVALTQDGDGVDVRLADGARVRAQYLVGCDGGRSGVRKMAGIEFPGWDATTSFLIAEVDFAEEPAWGFRLDATGHSAIGKIDAGPRARVVVNERRVVTGEAPTLEDVRAALVGVYGQDFGLQGAQHVSRFTDAARQAANYRAGRVLLAGDSAHVHSPVGGQGLNLGLQDAMNLGWKLARVVRGVSPAPLLDTYHAERHPVGARVLRNTLALTAMQRADDRTEALRGLVNEVMRADDARRQYIAIIGGLDIRYDFGDPEAHALVGRRMPDLEVTTDDGPRRVYTWLNEARAVLLHLGKPGDVDSGVLSDGVALVTARYEGDWVLPAIGRVSAPTAVLIRPDGYVAWVGRRSIDGLEGALKKWGLTPFPGNGV